MAQNVTVQPGKAVWLWPLKQCFNAFGGVSGARDAWSEGDEVPLRHKRTTLGHDYNRIWSTINAFVNGAVANTGMLQNETFYERKAPRRWYGKRLEAKRGVIVLQINNCLLCDHKVQQWCPRSDIGQARRNGHRLVRGRDGFIFHIVNGCEGTTTS